jgi:hypothetical protein
MPDTADARPAHHRRHLQRTLWAALWVALALLPTLLVNLGRGLDHDEHQFIAAGALLAREGLLPYRDFAYFHLPNLAFVYAALFRLTESLLLSARLFSLACGALLLLTTLLFVRRRWREADVLAPHWSEAIAVLLFGLTPLFVYTSGLAWNHDLPMLLGVWATLLLVYTLRWLALPMRAGRWGWLPWLWLVVAGLLAGFATGVRASFLFVLIPLAAAATVGGGARGGASGGVGRALLRLLAFGAGAAIGLLPVTWTAAQAPAAFLFGNLEYARINTAYRTAQGFVTGMTLPGKLALLGSVMLHPGNLLVIVAYAIWGLPVRTQWRAWPTHLRALVLVMLPFLLLGALLPTPAWQQYFYAFMPFLWLAALDGVAARPPRWWGSRTARRAVAPLILLLLALWGIANRAELYSTLTGEWIAVRSHGDGVEIADLLGPQSRVLTLEPILPLEGGLRIYPELATGPFALRAARMTTPEQQLAHHLPPVDALDGWLDDRPPRASLLRVDMGEAADFADEQSLAEWVVAPGFVPLPTRNNRTLWANPLAMWDENIRLGALGGIPLRTMPGDTLPLVNYLQALEPTSSDLSRVVRLRAADGTPAGRVAAQVEGWPWGQPTSGWEPGAVWFDGVQLAVPAEAAPGLYRLEVELYDPVAGAPLPVALGTGRYANAATYGDYLTVGVWPEAPTAPLRPETHIGDFANLQGYTLNNEDAPLLRLRLFWQGSEPAEADYTIFTQLLDGSGTPIAQHDKPPLDGFYPTTAWKPGLAFADDFLLPLPNPLPPGPYTLLVGMYDPTTGQRLPVTQRSRPAGDAVSIPVTFE